LPVANPLFLTKTQGTQGFISNTLLLTVFPAETQSAQSFIVYFFPHSPSLSFGEQWTQRFY
jgi:hypothetical protein